MRGFERLLLGLVASLAACAGDPVPDAPAADVASGLSDAPEPAGADGGAPEVAATDSAPADAADAEVASPDSAADASAPPDVPPQCPANWPSYSGDTPCAPGLQCDYGQECCCGSCAPSYVCTCGGSAFSCYYTDYCLSPYCSPGCTAGRFRTSEGCQPCDTIRAQLDEDLAAAAWAVATCQVSADCIAVTPAIPCGTACPVAVAAAGQDAYAELVAAVASNDCPTDTWGGYGCWFSNGPCAVASPACIAGTCHLVESCDAAFVPAGAACDDGSACTAGETCVADGLCQGAPLDCDDGNACTTDSCDPATGCVHAPNTLLCSPAIACSLGAQCQDGECVDSGLIGWTKACGGPGTWMDVAVAPVAGGGLAALSSTFAWAGDPQGAARLVRLDDTGNVSWDQTYPTAGGGTGRDLLVLGDGYLIVGEAGLDARLVRTDAAGDVVWSATYGGPATDRAATVAAAPGGYVFAGNRGTAAGGQELWLVRTDGSGAVLFDKTYSKLSPLDWRPLLAAVDGGFVLVAPVTVAGDYGELADVRVVRTDLDGIVMSDTTLAVPSNDFTDALVALPGGDVVLSGSSLAYSKEDKAFGGWLRRLALDGSVVWEVTFPGESVRALDVAPSGLVAVIGDPGGNALTHMVATTYSLSGAFVAKVSIPVALLPSVPIAGATMPGGFALVGVAYPPAPGLWVMRVLDACAE